MRLDLPAPQPGAASASEVTRQQLAIGLSELAQIPASSRLAPLTTHALAQVDLLGGVWQACPPEGNATSCAHLPTAPPIMAPADISAEEELALQVATDLVQLLSDDGALARSAAGIVPVYLAQLRSQDPDPQSAARQLLMESLDEVWTSDTGILQALDWGAWQLEAYAARESAASRDAAAARSTALRWRAAINAAAASQESWPGAAHRTEELTEGDILDQTARRLASRLPEVRAAEMRAVASLLTDITERLATLGHELPASWLAG